MASARSRRRGALVHTSLLFLLSAFGVNAAAPGATTPKSPTTSKESPALFGVGAHACKIFVAVSAEANGREIALSGAVFSWAQGWFSARNLIGHESSPLVVGGTLSADALKSMLVDECKAHPEEAIFLAVNDLYQKLAKKGQ
jgi:hypothetical protein